MYTRARFSSCSTWWAGVKTGPRLAKSCSSGGPAPRRDLGSTTDASAPICTRPLVRFSHAPLPGASGAAYSASMPLWLRLFTFPVLAVPGSEPGAPELPGSDPTGRSALPNHLNFVASARTAIRLKRRRVGCSSPTSNDSLPRARDPVAPQPLTAAAGPCGATLLTPPGARLA